MFSKLFHRNPNKLTGRDAFDFILNRIPSETLEEFCERTHRFA